MKKRHLIFSAIAVLAVLILFTGNVRAGSVTVAAFSDPSGNSGNPLFTVDWAANTVNGGWADSKSNLNLQIVLTDDTFTNAWFDMDQVAITSTTTIGGFKLGTTGSGQVRFYADGTSTNPVLVLDFETGYVGSLFYSAEDGLIGNNVTITGSAIPFALSMEQFSFDFANVTNFTVGDGFTATSAFTSSAVPEPATIAILGLGSLLLLRKRKA